RYVDWLERLEPTQRATVEQAEDPQARVKTIRELREQEWLHRQPGKFRKDLLKEDRDQRTRLIAKRRQEERQRRHDWQIAAPFWDDLQAGKPIHAKLSEFPADVQVFVQEYFRPQLSPQEKERLDKVEGRPLFPKVLVELADSHPMALFNPEH